MTRFCKVCNKEIEGRTKAAIYCSVGCKLVFSNKELIEINQHKISLSLILTSEVGTKIIYSTCGKEILVDANLYDSLNVYKWYVNGGYAKTKNVCMHRIIKPKQILTEDYVWDHIDRNRLNNTSDNLRYITTLQNSFNRKPKEGKLHKGVYKNRYGTYSAQIRHERILHHLGNFVTPKEAALAYNQAVLLYQGECGYLNKIE